MNSMTGFGSARQRDRHLDIDVELRSVNHRFLTLKQSLPDALARCEGEVEELVRSALTRGSVSLVVSVKSSDPTQTALPDLKLFRAYATRLRDIQKDLGLKGSLEFGDLLAIPALWSSANLPQPGPEVWPKVKKLVSRALQELASTRSREGEAIARDFKERLSTIEDRLARIRERVPGVSEAYQKKLDDRIQILLRQKGVEAARVDITKEVALYADRCDVSEEVHRLTAHIAEFRKIIGLKGHVGRRLDFLTQEMGRETNTIASKGNDSEISACAVEIKAELEKIKEQVDNVE
jgi:uncharacterized protein (TIGR00255 family)